MTYSTSEAFMASSTALLEFIAKYEMVLVMGIAMILFGGAAFAAYRFSIWASDRTV